MWGGSTDGPQRGGEGVGWTQGEGYGVDVDPKRDYWEGPINNIPMKFQANRTE